MKASPDAFVAKILQERQARKRFYFSIPGELLFSDSFNEIAGSGVAVTALLHVFSRQPFPPRKKEVERLKKARLWPPKPTEFSFPVREAQFHGLTDKGLAQGLRELHRVGLLDLIHQGSAKKGDYSVFVMSGRWKRWGQDDFKQIDWPKSKVIGVRDEATGRYLRRRGRKKVSSISFQSLSPGNNKNTADSAATGTRQKGSFTADSAATEGVVAADSATGRALVAADSTSTRNQRRLVNPRSFPLDIPAADLPDFLARGEWMKEATA